MLGCHDDPPAAAGAARSGECGQRAGGGGVLDVTVERVGKPDELPQPVGRHLLELLEGGRCPPEDPGLVEPGDQKLGQNAGLRAGGCEVGEEARALPVREPGHQDLVDVAQHVGERLRLLGWRSRERGPDLARLDACEHGGSRTPSR